MIEYIEQPPKSNNQKILNENIALGNKRIAEGTLFCFHCKKNKASKVIILSTMNKEEGAPPGQMRMLICGICHVCEMFTSEHDKQNAAHNLLVNNIIQ